MYPNVQATYTRIMVNFRVSANEKAALDALVARLQAGGRNHRYCVRGTCVAVSDVLRWGVEALRRELDADQAVADAAEYNAKNPTRKPAKAATPAKKQKASR